jgi:hypothetical protein
MMKLDAMCKNLRFDLRVLIWAGHRVAGPHIVGRYLLHLITPPLLVITTNNVEFELYIHQTQNNLKIRIFPCKLITLHRVLTFIWSHMVSAACNKWSSINEAPFLIQCRPPTPNSPIYPINEAPFTGCIVGRSTFHSIHRRHPSLLQSKKSHKIPLISPPIRTQLHHSTTPSISLQFKRPSNKSVAIRSSTFYSIPNRYTVVFRGPLTLQKSPLRQISHIQPSQLVTCTLTSSSIQLLVICDG